MPVLSEKEITRRRFISKVGGGIVGASVSGMLLKDANAQQLVVPDPPGKKLGWAIVGLGSLSIHEIGCQGQRLPIQVSCPADRGRQETWMGNRWPWQPIYSRDFARLRQMRKIQGRGVCKRPTI